MFAHTSGIATSVANFFAIFEAFITTTVGWTVASGAGTTDLVITSDGESTLLTMLFVRLNQNGPNPNLINGNVRDDAIGTHATTHTGYLDTAGQAFPYWISADKDTIVLVSKAGRSTRMLYLGCLLPYAITPPDESYYMIVTDNMVMSARILRDHTGLWNQTDNIYENWEIRTAGFDRFDGSAVL